MADLVTVVRTILSAMTLGSDIFIVLFIAAAIFRAVTRKKSLEGIWALLRRYSLELSFTVSLVATLGSLFFSEIAHFEPCELCWFQRIFMYPLVIIQGVALAKKDRRIRQYVLPLSFIGGSISAYHYLIQSVIIPASDSCSASGGVSCLIDYFTQFGYVTIPMMALTAFILIIILSSSKEKTTEKKRDS